MNIVDLVNSKTYVKENGAITFPSPKELIHPFIDNVKEEVEYVVKTADEVVNKEQESEELNIAYPKVLVQANFTTPTIPGFKSVVGMIYHLNVQKPVVKVYTGQEVSACLNLCVFNAEHVFQQDLLGNYRDVYAKAQSYIMNKQQEIEDYTRIYNDLVETDLEYDELQELLGDILLRATKNNMVSSVTKAAKLLTDSNSMYYINQGKDYKCNKWNVFNSITAALSNCDVAERPVKTLNVAKMLGVC